MLASKATRLGIAVVAVAVSLLAFQNCGRQVTSEPIVPLQSPFYGKKFYLDSTELAQLKAQNIESVPVSLVVNNRCALQTCAGNPGQEKAVVCQMIATDQLINQLQKYVQAYSWQIPADTTEQQLAERLSQTQADHDCVIGVSVTRQYNLGVASNDPLRASQYYHDVLRTEEALDFFSNDKLDPVKIGVIDTGVKYYAHEDLAGASGWIDWGGNSAKCTDICNFHGTFVSGIIGARRNNAKGGYGIAQNAQIRAYRVGDADGRIDSVELYNALNFYKVADPVEIINLSLGGSSSLDQTVQDAMVRLISDDVLFVIAAGNDGRSIDSLGFYPASFNYDSQINVGSASPITVLDSGAVNATTATGEIQMDGYSNYSPQLIHIAAPGRAIFSTTLNSTYANASGTSFSTPMVTGAVALVKGYLKRAGYPNVSASVLKQILLEGSATQPKLNGFIKDQKYLDLVNLKIATENFLRTMNTNPVQVNLISSETIVVGGAKQVRVVAEVVGGDPSALQTLRVYTNRAFLTDSYVASCSINMARQTCEFTIAYQNLLIDPEVYFALSTQAGTLVADLAVPKVRLQLGVKAESYLEGEIVSVQQGSGYFHAEGWVCLVGFPDVINIEVRSGSVTGPIVGNLQTARQARGMFFDKCAAPSIDFGFTYVVPSEVFQASANQNLFFKAVHQETGKTLALRVLSYQPGYNDPKPAAYVNSVFVDPVVNDLVPQIKITRREYNGWTLNLEGSACYYSNPRPLTLQLSFENQQPLSTLPEAWDGQGGILNQALTVQAATIASEGYNWTIVNTAPAASNLTGGTWGLYDSFSDISDIGKLTAPDQAGISVAKDFISLSSGISGQFPVPAGSAYGTLPVSYLIESRLRAVPAVEAIIPDLVLADGCRYPSGFKVAIDLRKYINRLDSSASLAWRSDLVTRAQAIARVPAAEQVLFQPSPNRTFAQLRFRSRAINPVISIPGAQITGATYQETKGGSASPYSAHFGRLFDQVNSARAALYNWSNFNPQAPSSYLETWVDYISGAGSGQLLPPWVWYTRVNYVALPALGPTLTTVYTSPQITTKLPNSNRFFAAVGFEAASVFGILGQDLRLEFSINGGTQWYEAPLDVAYQQGSSTNMSGMLMADVDAPTIFNTIQFRFKINGKNTLTVKGIGLITQ